MCNKCLVSYRKESVEERRVGGQDGPGLTVDLEYFISFRVRILLDKI